MTHIDFYILSSADENARLAFVSKLAEKIFQARRQLVIATEDESTSQLMSQQLWSARPESFLAHDLGEKFQQPSEAIIVTNNQPHPHCHDVLINLTEGVLENHFSRFQRLVEIVNQNEDILARSRKIFQFYRERGYPIKSHKLKH